MTLEWKPIEEMPKDRNSYLVCDKWGSITTAFYVDDQFFIQIPELTEHLKWYAEYNKPEGIE